MLTISDRLVTLVLFTTLAFTHLGDVEGQVTKNAEGVVVHIGYQKFNTLKGKIVAVGKGWNCQYQIVEALEKAGLKYADIKPAYVTSAADARENCG